MIILSASNICLSFGTDTILDNITFAVEESDKIGVVGVNGAGKSTLFKILNGDILPDSGDIYTAKGCKIGFLRQNSGLDSQRSIWDEMLETFSELIEMEKRMSELEKQISAEKDKVRLSSLMNEYSVLSDKFARSGGYEYNTRAKGVLKGLGFEEDEFNKKVEVLSGGQKTRLALAKLLLKEPDILLLDEPTNHLDINALEWLEDFLKNYKKAVLVISHDRYFLDMVTNKTIEIENNKNKVFKGNYTEYLKQKALDREIQQKHYELQQKEIARLEAFIEQQRRWNREKNIRAAESRQKAIDRMEKIEKPENLPSKIRIKFRSSIISGNDVLFVENLSKEFPGKPLFNNINFKLQRNERVFILGPNGCGKSTLLKILTGNIEKTSGVFEYGHNVNIGYYDQELSNLDESKTVLEEILDLDSGLTLTELRNLLASFLFTGDDVTKPISVLSGGERSRVSLIKLILSGANFLVLDEPTNHLDINSREALEDALMNFDGTILSVSHDRYFIKKLSTRILEFDNGSLSDYKLDYVSYLKYKEQFKKADEGTTCKEQMSESKINHIASKQERARIRKLEKDLNQTENDIAETEAKLKEIEAEMVKDEVVTNHIRLRELHEEQMKLSKKLDELYELWETLEVENEQLKSEGKGIHM